MPASIIGEVDHLSDEAAMRERAGRRTLLKCPSCGSAHVAQVLGDNGGVSYVCTACGHSWS
ncbi:IS1 family transposase OS=Streptomyces alboniger OX=132473 GN=CP975_11660 PE=4 SV=1 [Streptomyces alboniger]